MVLYWPIA